MQSQKIYVEPEKKLTVSYDVDVLVCGGGPSGIAAAVSAAKNGAEVLLIERFNCLGGQGTVGLVTSFMSMSAYTGGRQVIKGGIYKSSGGDGRLYQATTPGRRKTILFGQPP